MPKELVRGQGVPEPRGVWSPGIIAEGRRLIFVSGAVAEDEAGNVVGVGDVEAQTRRALDNMRAVLRAAGADLEQVVKVTVFVVDMGDWAKVHAVRREYFQPPYPASSMVEVSRLYRDGLLVEIEAIAVAD